MINPQEHPGWSVSEPAVWGLAGSKAPFRLLCEDHFITQACLSSSVWWECDSEMCPQPVSARAWLCDWSRLGREVTEGSNNKGWEKRESKPGPLVLRGAEICHVTNNVTAERAGKSSGRENGELGCQRAWPASAECEAAAANCLATETAKEGRAWQRQPTGRAAPA